MDQAPLDIVDRLKVIEVADDLCDAKNCGAKSYVFAQMPNGHSVSYCGHHGTEYWAGLNRTATVVIDLRHTILDPT